VRIEAAVRFSWTGLILAPLAVPLFFSPVLAGLFGSNSPVLGFLILLIPGCIVSYGTTVFLFLPALFLLSCWRLPTWWQVCLLGLVLGTLVIVPVTLMEWKSTGPDSGPPTESFVTFFLRWGTDPIDAIFPMAGLVTAGLYWWLGTWRLRAAGAAVEGSRSTGAL
jgi:hypothetical protein